MRRERVREKRLWTTWGLALILTWLSGTGLGLGAVGGELLIGPGGEPAAARNAVNPRFLKGEGGISGAGEEFLIGPGWRTATAFDPTHQRFLVLLNGGDRGQLLDATGTLVGPPIPVAMCCEAQVAYDTVNGRYLVVAGQWDNGSVDIFGQLINADGTLLGSRLLLATGPNNQYFPSLAYDPVNKGYLVAWREYNGSDYDIFGQMVNADGTLFGAGFPLATGPNWQDSPSVARDSTNQRYLVTWVENGLPWGRLVNADGSLFGSPFQISPNCCANWPGAKTAYDANNGRFLVAWGSGDIHGQLVNANGTLFGAVIPISQEDQWEGSPDVAYNPVKKRYLVAWGDDYTTNVHGREVNADGTLPGIASPITNAPGWQQTPALASDTLNGRFLVAWVDGRDIRRDWEVYGILLGGLPAMPVLSLQLNTQTFGVGDPFRLKVRVQTPLLAPPSGSWRVEVAAWIRTPLGFPNDLISLVNLGGSQALDLPPGFDQTFTVLDLPSLPPVPTGRYEAGGRLNHPVTREEFIWDVERFEVVP